MRTLLGAGLLVLSLSSYAGGFGAGPGENSPWVYGFGMGFTHYQGMILNDGQTVLGRLFLGQKITEKKGISIGVELGMQTGNNSRANLTAQQSFDLGNVAVQTFIKPTADLLATFNKPINQIKGMAGFIKAGIAYRQLHFDRDTINTLRKVNPELQIGLSKCLSKNTSLSLAYQGIYSGNLGLTTTNPTNLVGQGTGRVKNIPTQHGVLLTISAKA